MSSEIVLWILRFFAPLCHFATVAVCHYSIITIWRSFIWETARGGILWAGKIIYSTIYRSGLHYITSWYIVQIRNILWFLKTLGLTIKSVVFTRYFMYQVDLIKGEIPKYQKVKKICSNKVANLQSWHCGVS